VAGIIEAQHRLAARGAGLVQDGGFSAAHVGGEAGQKDHRGTVARVPLKSEFDAVRTADG
jgi:hypothetical protein